MGRIRGSLAALAFTMALAACSSGDATDIDEPAVTGTTDKTGATAPEDELVGTWKTPPMTTAEHIAAAKAAGCSAEIVGSFFETWPYDEAVHAIRFQDGSFTEFASYDGGRDEPGSSGAYEASDGTLTLIEDVGTMSIDYTVAGDELTLRLRDFDCPEVPPAFIFQGSAFFRVNAGEATGAEPVQDPLEGTWTTVLTPALEKQAALAAGIEASHTVEQHEELFGGSGPVTIVVTFEDGQLIHTAAVEGGQPEVGWSGEYEIVDEDTFVAGDPGDLYIEYTYAIDGDQLVLDMVRDDYPAVSENVLAGEIYAQTVIYESAPFIREA